MGVLFHAAGVLQDGMLRSQTLQALRAVFAAKLGPMQGVNTQAQAMPLEKLILFSSVASLLGTAGQANYAAANAGLDAWSTPFGMCVYGKQYGEAQLVKVASAMEDLFQWNEKPGWFNYKTAKGPWDETWPGYTCSEDSLEHYSCEPEA